MTTPPPGPPKPAPKPAATPTPKRPTRADESMTLLHNVMHRPLDPSYAIAAANTPTNHKKPLWWVICGAALATTLGLGLATAITELRAPTTETSRDALKETVRDRSTEVRNRTARVQQLRNDLTTAGSAGLTTTERSQLRQLPAHVGRAPITGPAAQWTLTDPQRLPAPGNTTEDNNARVLDADLQIVVNQLWASGAQAIDVNGVRLTPNAAIREAGAAILVDYRPLNSPYIVTAIGPANQITNQFNQSPAQNHLAFLTTKYGVQVATKKLPEWTAPAGTNTSLRYAQAHNPNPQTTTPTGGNP